MVDRILWSQSNAIPEATAEQRIRELLFSRPDATCPGYIASSSASSPPVKRPAI
jgi:hypothetical protein